MENINVINYLKFILRLIIRILFQNLYSHDNETCNDEWNFPKPAYIHTSSFN